MRFFICWLFFLYNFNPHTNYLGEFFPSIYRTFYIYMIYFHLYGYDKLYYTEIKTDLDIRKSLKYTQLHSGDIDDTEYLPVCASTDDVVLDNGQVVH